MKSFLDTAATKTMADFRPLRGWRYDPAKIDFQKVMAPPYDVISPTQQEKLYGRSPYNCIRLILNKIENSDTPDSNRYARARNFYETWKKEGVLTQEKEPCFYLYRQTFKHPEKGILLERSALLGRVKLEPFEKGIVIPHEKTLSRPREDRKKLLEATHTNFSPVFGLYQDPQGEVKSILNGVDQEPPLFEAVDEEGVRHRVWVISGFQQMEHLHQQFSSHKIYIADGHHRYQTALEYNREVRHRQNTPEAGELLSDFVLMALVEFEDPGLVLLPTHRMVLPYAAFPANPLEALKKYFDVQLVDRHCEEAVGRRSNPDSEIASLPSVARNDISFTLVLGRDHYQLTLRDFAAAKREMPQGKPGIWYRFDLNVLAHLVFARLWNLPESEWENVLRFTHHAPEAIEAVKSGKAKAAFLIQAPRTQLLQEMGEAGQLMPQKSTYFYPKLASGIVFYSHH